MKKARLRRFLQFVGSTQHLIVFIAVAFLSLQSTHLIRCSKIAPLPIHVMRNVQENSTLHHHLISNSTSENDVSKPHVEGNFNLLSSFDDTTFNQSNLTSNQSSKDENSTNRVEKLDHSDSRLIPQLASPHLDTEYDTATEEDGPEEDDASYDGASSNLNHQKVVKELTKVISKGMSGATDQMKLETLENWRRKQRERKLMKDNRAKLFEDLLMAAIASHPETGKKKGIKKRTKEPSSSKTTATNSLGLMGSDNIDPELSVDAESVLQHLQGLATVVDSPTPIVGSVSDAQQQGDEIESADGEADQGEVNSQSVKSSPSSTADRPIMKRFKRIKQQFSQRRKQLEHIKKLFNVELALNPKDGSLMGKSANHRKGSKDQNALDVGDYTIIDDNTGVSKRKSTKDQSAMRDLMLYLKNNPEILVSVIAELSGDADTSRSSRYPLIYDEESSSFPELIDNPKINSPKRKSGRYKGAALDEESSWDRSKQHARGHEGGHDNEPYSRGSVTRMSRLKDPTNDDFYTPPQRHLETYDGHTKSAEALLLESLRERQLLNLAKLDKVMAERLQASNRSHVYSSLNSPNPNRLNNAGSPVSVNQSDPVRRPAGSSTRQSSRQDEEVTHHYMVVGHGETDTMPNKVDSDRTPKVRFSVADGDGNNGFHLAERSLDRLTKNPYLDRENGSSFKHPLDAVRQNHGPLPALNRFREWSDVSQSEASSSHRSNKANLHRNGTWMPYDLNTGSASSAISESLRPQALDGIYRLQSRSSSLESPTNNKIAIDSGDLSVTRPGPTRPLAHSRDQEKNQVGFAYKSIFTTRSSIPQDDGKQMGALTGRESANEVHSSAKTLLPGKVESSDIGNSLIENKRHSKQSPGYRFDEDAMKQGGITPVDYFKDYKQNSETNQYESENSDTAQEESLSSSIDRTDDSMGAMWASR